MFGEFRQLVLVAQLELFGGWQKAVYTQLSNLCLGTYHSGQFRVQAGDQQIHLFMLLHFAQAANKSLFSGGRIGQQITRIAGIGQVESGIEGIITQAHDAAVDILSFHQATGHRQTRPRIVRSGIHAGDADA